MLSNRKRIVGVLLVSALILGAAANGAVLAAACAPKACCCRGTGAIAGPDNSPMIGSDGCEPIGPSPCCHVEPLQPKNDAALSSVPAPFAYRTVMGLAPLQDMLPRPQLLTSNRYILKTTQARASLVPIYLLTMSILC
jgi:hypothetical protein